MTTNLSQFSARRHVNRPWLAFGLAGCIAGWATPVKGEVWPGSTWTTVPAAQVSMDPGRTEAVRDFGADRGGSGIITRWSRRVAYWGDQRRKYDLKSTTKSFGSILTALAFKDRPSLTRNSLVRPILPEIVQAQNTTQRKNWASAIEVRHLLTHAAGYGKVGGFTNLEFAPGTAWRYSDGGTNWLADLMTVVYGADLQTVLRQRVLAPMGISNDRLIWRTNRYRSGSLRGITRREFGSGISTDVDVMARIGVMLLRDGRWNNRQILRAEDVERASTHRDWLARLPCRGDDEQCEPPLPNNSYGFLFWTNNDGGMPGVPRDAFYSYGLYDSFILVIPSLGIVAARAGPDWGSSTADFFKLVATAVK